MREPYVPKVGDLVNHKDGLCNPYLVIWVGEELCEIVSHNLRAGTSWTVNKSSLTFLADRSAEWEALFQLPNAAAIHQHQSGTQTDSLEVRVKALEKNGGLRKRVQTLEWKEASADARVEELARRIQELEDAPGPRPNADEVSALRQRMDALTETLEKMRSLDTSDVLAALVRDVALLKDALRFLADTKATSKSDIEAMEGFIRDSFGTVPQTPEARAWVEAMFKTLKP